MNSRQMKAEQLRQQALVDGWQHPEGTKVHVRKDDGSTHNGATRSAPWLMGGCAVILVTGISGGYRLDRCTPCDAQVVP